MPKISLKNGLNVYYETYGSPENPILICNNGILGNVEAWYPILPFFTDHFQVILHDQRGQGRTISNSAPYSMKLLSDDLSLFMDALEIKNADFIGVSGGGVIGFLLALNAPERVRRIVGSGIYVKLSKYLELVLNGWIEAEAAGGRSLRFAVSAPWLYEKDFLVANYQELKARWEQKQPSKIERVRNAIQAQYGLNIESQLASINVPILLISGDQDILSPPNTIQRIIDRLPNAKVEFLVGVGHNVMIENKELFCDLCLSFLSKGQED